MAHRSLTRRRLLASGVTVGAALAGGIPLAAARPSATAVGVPRADADNPDATGTLTFFDPRFPHSRPLAFAMARGGALQPIGGDPSHLLPAVSAARAAPAPLRLQGITTETVPFCLELSCRSCHEVSFASRRLDRDLFEWTLTVHA